MKANVGAANRAQRWPSTPLATAATVAEMATADLLDLVVQAGYTGQVWAELQRRLVDRAFPDLERALRSGAIYLRCAQAGFKIPRRTELQVRPYPEEIAAEAVEDCLLRFRARVLPAGEWNPDQGTSLEDFFCACCLPDVANPLAVASPSPARQVCSPRRWPDRRTGGPDPRERPRPSRHGRAARCDQPGPDPDEGA